MRNTELRDIQQYCEKGKFPARRPPYDGVVSFDLYFELGFGPHIGRDKALQPDKCKTVGHLKHHIEENFELWFDEKVVLEGAILQADEYPNVQTVGFTKFSIDHDDDESWQKWRERNLAYGRKSFFRILVMLCKSENPQLNRVFRSRG